MKETLNILFSCNSGYAIPLTVSITSIFENHKEYPVAVYVLYSILTEEQKDILNNLAKSYRQTIHLIPVADHYFDTAPTLRWTKETYYRLLIQELLPKTLGRILYLDCDIIVHKSLNDLFKINLDNYSLAALPEIKSFRERLGLSKKGQYFQAGVIVFDTHKTKGILTYENSIAVLKSIGGRLIAVDQDVINVMFDGKIKAIDEKFNNCNVTNFYHNNIYRILNSIPKEKLDDTVIFHYSAGKPWNNMFSGSAEQIWYTYLKLSPYKYLYYEKYSRLKYKILRSGICKIIFYTYTQITPTIDSFMKTFFSKDAYIKIKNYYRTHIK